MRKSIQARLALSAIVAAFVVVFIVIAGSHSTSAQMGPLGGLRPPVVGGLGGWLVAKQAIFYRALAGTIRSAKGDGTAFWGLLGISFAYGIFHAAGPGHGKAVISSYLFANGETWRRGVALSFASALMQSLTAVAIVGIAAVLLGATAKLTGDAVRVIEIVSYSLIAVLGARLTWVKGHGLLKVVRALQRRETGVAAVDPHAHAHWHHDHGEQTDDHHHAHAYCVAEQSPHGNGHDHCHQEEEPDVLPWGQRTVRNQIS